LGVDDFYVHALVVGRVSTDLVLPGGIVGRQREVRVSADRIRHIALRRPEWLAYGLRHASDVLEDPAFLGWRPHHDRRRIEFVRRVGQERRLLLVAVKFLDDDAEAWISTMHPMKQRYLTRRLRADTLWPVGRAP
jgi:hypothetical protein